MFLPQMKLANASKNFDFGGNNDKCDYFTSLWNSNREQQLLSTYNEFRRKIVAELNNIGTDLYGVGEITSAMSLYKHAAKPLLAILRSKQDNSTIENDQYVNEIIVRAKEKLHHIKETTSNSFPGRRRYTNTDRLDFYPTSSSTYDDGPRCLCEAVKIDVMPSSPNSMPLTSIRDEIRRDSAMVFFNMGLAYHREKMFDDALQLYRNAIAMMPPSFKSLLLAAAINNMGHIFYVRGLLETAKNNFIKALEIGQDAARGITDEVQQRKADRYIGTIMSNAGRVYFARGQDNDALNMCQDCLLARESAFGTNHVDVAVTMFNIGLIQCRRANTEEAMYMYMQFLNFVISNDVVSSKDDAIDLAISLNHIGQTYEQCDRKFDAMDCYKTAIMKGNAHIKSHKIFAIIIYNIGLLHYRDENYDKTLKAFDESINLLRCLLGDDHPDIAAVLYDIGFVQLETDKVTEALASFRESFQMRTLVLGLKHRHVAESLYQIGKIKFSMGNYDRSMKIFQEVFRIQKVAFGSEAHYHVAETLYMIGRTLHCRGEHREALTVFEKSLKIAESSKNDDEVLTANIHTAIASIHLEKSNMNHAASEVSKMLIPKNESSLCSDPSGACRQPLQKKSYANATA